MNGRDDAYEEIEAHAVARLQIRRERFAADTGDTCLAVRLVGKRVVQIVGQLTVDAERLKTLEDGVARTFEHDVGLAETRAFRV